MRTAQLSDPETFSSALAPAAGVDVPLELGARQRVATSLVPAALVAFTLVATDLLAVAASLGIAALAADLLWPAMTLDISAVAVALTAAVLAANLAFGLYPGIGLNAITELRLASLTAAGILAVFACVVLPQQTIATPLLAVVGGTCLLLALAMPLLRQLARRLAARGAWWGQPALIVGADESADAIRAFLDRNPHIGLRPLGVACDWPREAAAPPPVHWLGPLARAGALVRELNGPWLIVALGRRPAPHLRRAVRDLHSRQPHRLIATRLDGASTVWSRVGGCLEWPALDARITRPALWARTIKRAVDLVAASLIALLLLPVMIALTLAIRLTSTGPAIYRQERVGLHGRRFTVWKFRTMVCDGDRVLADYLAANPEARACWERDHKLATDPRITRVGHFLRKTSLDELPQLWNVLRGHMSLVGPRPILAREIADFGDNFAAFASVPPGMTGLWQVSGRNRTTYAEHIELDRYYARNWSLWLDAYILVLTVRVVLFRHGAY